MVGGYQLIDLKGGTLNTATPITVDGVYNTIIKSKKEIRLVNVNFIGQEVKVVTVTFTEQDGLLLSNVITFGSGAFYLEVTSDDVITLKFKS